MWMREEKPTYDFFLCVLLTPSVTALSRAFEHLTLLRFQQRIDTSQSHALERSGAERRCVEFSCRDMKESCPGECAKRKALWVKVELWCLGSKTDMRIGD